MRCMTKRGYDLMIASSAMQKAIRRGDGRLAGYFAMEMVDSGYLKYVWRRLFIISAEDVFGLITGEVEALYRASEIVAKGEVNKAKAHPERRTSAPLFPVKAAILLALAAKSRDADNLINVGYDRNSVTVEELAGAVAEAQASPERVEIPEYAYDYHTLKGRRAGESVEKFIVHENRALNPHQHGLFDADVEALGKKAGVT